MTGFLLATLYISMAVAAFAVELLFESLGLVPEHGQAHAVAATINWDYTTWLNVLFLTIAGLLVWRFLRTGGPEMLRMMNRPSHANHAENKATNP